MRSMRASLDSNIAGCLFACILAALPAFAYPHGESARRAPQGASAVETSFGREGDPRKVSRTVRVELKDSMRFSPASLVVKEGETIRLVVRNSGKLMHEFVLGTLDELGRHAELMRAHPGMEHDEPHMAHVAPGRTGSIVWTFSRPGEFHFACLVPGHFEAGMVGTLAVTLRPGKEHR